MLKRPRMSGLALALATTFYLLVFTNRLFWTRAGSWFEGHHTAFAAFIAVLVLLHVAALAPFTGRHVIKPVAILLILIAAAGSWFGDRFGVILDREMIANALETTSTEASHLLTPQFALHMLLYGLVPSALVALVAITPLPGRTVLRRGVLAGAGSLALAAILLAAESASFIPMWREQRTDMMSRLLPATPIVGAASLGVRQFRQIGIDAQPYGTDATPGPALASARKKMLLVLVVGETARAANFSLDGYARDTNPELAASGAISFTNATSCGTATAVSVPCMFSRFDRKNYSNIKGRGSENLLDVLKHAGLHVEWWENNTGSKTVADRVEQTNFYRSTDPAYCNGGECNDDILVDNLRRRIGGLDGNTVLVLHSGGSHGPAYYLRYPRQFARFTPDCRTGQISDCSQQELVNAYDNSILFTDHVLAEMIGLLREHEAEFASALLYVSDHGESLGESGLYLHGTPWFLAPSEQTHIPMIAWLSPDFAATDNLDLSCLNARRDQPVSHDNLFATVLGMMDISTAVYQPAMDAFAACRSAQD